MYTREILFRHIQYRFAHIDFCIKTSSALNLLSNNVWSENFFRDLMNQLHSLNYVNANTSTSNYKTIDLHDEKAKKSCQVTSEVTKAKINSTTTSFKDDNLSQSFDELIILFLDSKVRNNWKNEEHDLGGATIQIIDMADLLGEIMNLTLDKLQELHDFIAREIVITDDQQESLEELAFKELFSVFKNPKEHSLSTEEYARVADDGNDISVDIPTKELRFKEYWDIIKELYIVTGSAGDAEDGLALEKAVMRREAVMKELLSELTDTDKRMITNLLRYESTKLLAEEPNPVKAIDLLAEMLISKFKLYFIDKTLVVNFLYHRFFSCSVFPNPST